MVTNYPQQLTATAEISQNSTGSLAARTLGRLGQFVCGLRGHDAVLHFEGNRVNMRCTSCGHETPGWTLTHAAPRIVFRGDARRHMLTRPQLVGARRTA